jgi:hypothetical protein
MSWARILRRAFYFFTQSVSLRTDRSCRGKTLVFTAPLISNLWRSAFAALRATWPCRVAQRRSRADVLEPSSIRYAAVSDVAEKFYITARLSLFTASRRCSRYNVRYVPCLIASLASIRLQSPASLRLNCYPGLPRFCQWVRDDPSKPNKKKYGDWSQGNLVDQISAKEPSELSPVTHSARLLPL